MSEQSDGGWPDHDWLSKHAPPEGRLYVPMGVLLLGGAVVITAAFSVVAAIVWSPRWLAILPVFAALLVLDWRRRARLLAGPYGPTPYDSAPYGPVEIDFDLLDEEIRRMCEPREEER